MKSNFSPRLLYATILLVVLPSGPAEALVALKNAGIGEKIIMATLVPTRGKPGPAAPFGFPQAEAQILCDQEDLRVSVWTNANYLYVQAIVWADREDTVVETDDGRKSRDWSVLSLDVNADQISTTNVDRTYSLNPTLTSPGLHYDIVKGRGTTVLQHDSAGRGAIRYLDAGRGSSVRVDSFLIPLEEIKRKPGDELRIAYWAHSQKPKLTLNSLGYEAQRKRSSDHEYYPYYAHQLPKHMYHTVKISDSSSPLDLNQVPEGRGRGEATLVSPQEQPAQGTPKSHESAAIATPGSPGSEGQEQVEPLRWKFETGSSVDFIPLVADGIVYVGSSDEHLYALDAGTGRLLWKFKADGGVNGSGASGGGLVFFTNQYRDLRPGAVYLYALDAATGRERWRFDPGSRVSEDVAVFEDLVFAGVSDGLVALDAHTGKPVWKSDAAFSSPVTERGIVCSRGPDGYLHGLNARDGTLKWSLRIGLPSELRMGVPLHYPVQRRWHRLSVADGVVYAVGAESAVYAVDLATGEERWRFEPPTPFFPATHGIEDGELYVAYGNHLYAVDTLTGVERWRLQLDDEWIHTPPVVADDTVYLGTTNMGAVKSLHGAAHVYAVDIQQRSIKGRFHVREAVTYEGGLGPYLRMLTRPVVAAGTVYFGSAEHVYAVRRDVAFEPLPAPAPVRVSGRVLASATGEPLDGAVVMLGFDTGTITDSRGRYEFRDLPKQAAWPTVFTLSAKKRGYLPAESRWFELAEGQVLKNVDLRLAKAGSITGRITDEGGRPVAGVEVSLLQIGYDIWGQRKIPWRSKASTDESGRYRLSELRPGEYYVSAVPKLRRARQLASEGSAYGYTFYPGTMSLDDARPLTLAVEEDLSEVDFSLVRTQTARVSGVVIGPDGKPVAKGTVSLSPFEQYLAASRGSLRPDGTFEIPGVLPGRYGVWAKTLVDSGEEEELGFEAITVSGADIIGLKLLTARGAVLKGKVLFEGPKSPTFDLNRLRIMADIPPDLSRMQRPPGAYPGSRVEDDGTFELRGLFGPRLLGVRGLNPRQWVLKAVVFNGRDVTDAAIDFKARDPGGEVQVVLTSRVTEITGNVLDWTGGPIPAGVIAFADDPSLWQTRFVREASLDPKGRFTIRGLPPGNYLIAAVDSIRQELYAPDFLHKLRASATPFRLEEGEVKAIVVPLKPSG